MGKKISITALLFLLLANLCAQKCDTASAEHIYWIEGAREANAGKVVAGENSEVYLIGNVSLPDGYYQGTANYKVNVYITKVTAKGTPVWTKRTSDPDRVVFMNDAVRCPDGGFVLAGDAFPDNQPEKTSPWIGRFDGNGNVLWTYVLGIPLGHFSSVIATKDGGCVAVGSLAREFQFDSVGNESVARNHAIALKLDANGNEVWGRDFYDDVPALGGADVISVIESSDGSIIINGSKDVDQNNPHKKTYAFLTKLDNTTGLTLWQIQSPGVSGDMKQLKNGNLVLRTETDVYIVNGQTGAILLATTFSTPQVGSYIYPFYYAGSIAEGEDIYYNYSDRKHLSLLQLHDYDSICWIRSTPSYIQFGHLTYSRAGMVQTTAYGGNIYVVSDFENAFGQPDISYMEKVGLDGKSFCSDTFALPFTFKPIVTEPMASFEWEHEYSLQEAGKTIIKGDTMFTFSNINCYNTTCCKDTVINHTINICSTDTYTLPDGKKVNQSGRYTTLLKRVTGCDSVILVTVNVVPPAKAHLGSDSCFKENKPIIIQANAAFADNYRWQDGTTDSVYSATVPGTYWVQTNNVCGTTSDTMTIYPVCDFPVYIPSAFTPNGDSKNDIFRVLDMRGQHLLDFSIYNRWGQCVFKTSNAQKGWDGNLNGRPLPTETYVYIVHYVNLAGKGSYLKGTVSLIR